MAVTFDSSNHGTASSASFNTSASGITNGLVLIFLASSATDVYPTSLSLSVGGVATGANFVTGGRLNQYFVGVDDGNASPANPSANSIRHGSDTMGSWAWAYPVGSVAGTSAISITTGGGAGGTAWTVTGVVLAGADQTISDITKGGWSKDGTVGVGPITNSSIAVPSNGMAVSGLSCWTGVTPTTTGTLIWSKSSDAIAVGYYTAGSTQSWSFGTAASTYCVTNVGVPAAVSAGTASTLVALISCH